LSTVLICLVSSKTIRKIINPAPGVFSDAVQVNDTLYITGKIGTDPKTGKLVEGGIKAETRQVLLNIGSTLKAAGSSFSQIVKTTVLMANIDEISIVKPGPEHIDQITRLLQESFVPREPLSVALGLTWEDETNGFGTNAETIVRDGCSFVALNPEGRVVGCSISSVSNVERGHDPEHDFIPIAGETAKLKLARTILRGLMSGWTKEVPDCRTILEFGILCVEAQYAGRRIGERLVERSLRLAEELRVDYIYTVATNLRTQRVFAKLGFDTMRTKNCDEFLDEAGNQVLKMSDGTTCLKWMVKRVKQ